MEQLVPKVLSLVEKSSRMLRIVRMFRLVRIVRFGRLLHVVAPLRMLLVSIQACLHLLCWALFLLFMITFLFGIVLTELTLQHRLQDANDTADPELLRLYGSLFCSMLTLYQICTAGTDWAAAMEPLAETCSRELIAVIFILYTAFVLLSVMNIITGLFVDSAIQSAIETKRESIVRDLSMVFGSTDTDGSGSISYDEFRKLLHHPRMQVYLKSIDVTPEDGSLLFPILDDDGSGEINSKELVHGCMRLYGSAKHLEMSAFVKEIREATCEWSKRQKLVEDLLREKHSYGQSHSKLQRPNS
eukprot:gnl/TRDRNA2_/TRDRNA2_176615_c0_seq1.p1 gnl/TRDRNA2_/TRDRNA2_176615_c0~~gnl/TRDRNA2_/TRDRNA2_176615_c0_seq1.p1  ORF type:complete len:301 (-),score=34.05 gnl/TRDRNA2_/TRDRNA2_176615_c0_seq1:43-945(-)